MSDLKDHTDNIIEIGMASIDAISPSFKALAPAFKIWRMIEEGRVKYFLKGAAKELGDEDQVHTKLREVMEEKKNREYVALLMERVRKSESVWATYCLGILLGKVLNDEILEIHELIFADILSRLDDNDLSFLCRLQSFIQNKNVTHKINWEQEKQKLTERFRELEQYIEENQSSGDDVDYKRQLDDAKSNLKSHEFKKFPSVRIEQDDLQQLDGADHDGLLLTRMRVDRLTFSGVFSGDCGGWGGSGLAHGTFVWHEITEKFFQFIIKNRYDD